MANRIENEKGTRVFIAAKVHGQAALLRCPTEEIPPSSIELVYELGSVEMDKKAAIEKAAQEAARRVERGEKLFGAARQRWIARRACVTVREVCFFLDERKLEA